MLQMVACAFFWGGISQVICINDAVGVSANPQHTTTDVQSVLLGREFEGKTGPEEKGRVRGRQTK